MNSLPKLSYFLVLDASYSMISGWRIVESIVTAHFDRFTEPDQSFPPISEFYLSTFNHQLHSYPPTSDVDELKATMKGIQPEGQSALYDALGIVLTEICSKFGKERWEDSVCVLVFYTDARDNSSSRYTTYEINELLRKIKAADFSGNRFKGVILGTLPEGIIGMEVLEVEESSESFSEELTLSFSYLEEVIKKMLTKG